MRVTRQNPPLNIKNYDEFLDMSLVSKERHGALLPDSIRCIISGPSNSGKTNILFNLLFDLNGLVYKHIYVFSKSLYQPKYKFLPKALPKEIGYFAYDDNDLVVHPSKAKPHSIMIFDDISCEKHGNIKNFFTMGRHNNIDVFYLGQTYSAIPKQLVRDNTNFIILFKQDDMNLKHIYSDHVTTDMPFDKFRQICSEAWEGTHGFLVIDKSRDPNMGRYRIRLDSFIEVL